LKRKAVEMKQASVNLRMTFATMSAALLLLSWPAYAQSTGEPAFSPGFRFIEKSGEQLFVNVCRGCHMSDAKGATGAGTYPSLADDSNLISSGYPVGIVVNGQRGMPAFGEVMNDDQIAAVVNYVRTHFGNGYQDAVTAEDVRAVRR
jgi:mono/diheme cytochrome c family protein